MRSGHHAHAGADRGRPLLPLGCALLNRSLLALAGGQLGSNRLSLGTVGDPFNEVRERPDWTPGGGSDRHRLRCLWRFGPGFWCLGSGDGGLPSSLAKRFLRLLSGRSRRSSPSSCRRSNAYSMASLTVPRRCRASKMATPSGPHTTASPSSAVTPSPFGLDMTRSSNGGAFLLAGSGGGQTANSRKSTGEMQPQPEHVNAWRAVSDLPLRGKCGICGTAWRGSRGEAASLSAPGRAAIAAPYHARFNAASVATCDYTPNSCSKPPRCNQPTLSRPSHSSPIFRNSVRARTASSWPEEGYGMRPPRRPLPALAFRPLARTF
jgi:hypothetical protein